MLEESGVVVARVAKTFGSAGELTLNLFDTFPRDFALSEPLFVIIDRLAVPLFFDRFERRGQRGAVVTFGDFDTERRATELVGLQLYLGYSVEEEFEDDEDAEGRIYLEDLVGYKAVFAGINDDASDNSDAITEFIDGENPLFAVKVGNRSVYIPAVEEFMVDINTDAQIVEFDIPDGLLDLNRDK